MPVRINETDPASFCITMEELQNGIQHFKDHYFLASGGEFNSDFTTSWNDLAGAVQAYKTQFPDVPEEDIAMRFIHSYDPTNASLFLRLQICQKQLTTITEYNCDVSQLLDNTNQKWFELSQNTITETSPSTFDDPVYLNAFIYKPLGIASEMSESLASDGGLKFVRTLTFPWLSEIYQMYQDNGAPQDPPNDVKIHYCATSYTEATPGSAAVLWPHGLVIYMEVNGEVLLDNNASLTIFHYKGADLATACPPKCGSYVTPTPFMI